MKVSITRQTTDSASSSARTDLPSEPEASLRKNLRAQIDGAQAELAANLAQLRSGGDDTALAAQGEAQLGALSALQRQLDGANPFAMAMMRASIAASVAASYNLAQQVRTAAASPAQGADAAQQLATASAEARSAVTGFMRDMYERKIFEPCLHFTSKEDEDAYRKREAETKRAIEDALKLNTPEGNLRAAELSAAQLKDAGAHGAMASPDYKPALDRLNESTAQLSQQIESTAQAKSEAHRLAFADSSPTPDTQAPLAIPADLIARLRNTGVTSTDSASEGHGVTNVVMARTIPSPG